MDDQFSAAKNLLPTANFRAVHVPGIEFLWRKSAQEEGQWCRGTFVRRCVGSTHEAKIRYQFQQRDLECVANMNLGFEWFLAM